MHESQFLSVHCQYYQPPRGNPFGRNDVIELDAAPHPNWTARITAEAYEPNGKVGNYEHISFNLAESLAAWLSKHAPKTFQYFIEADRANVERYGAGNAITQPLHHTVLPLDRSEDKHTQIKWGKAVFAHRFGRQTTGMWLPEMAVDSETLAALADNGISWTILTERQVDGKPSGAGPYWVDLPGGKRIKVFVRDEALSNDIAFNLGSFGGAGRWARQVLVPRKRDAGPLTLIATDGETFGHHWPSEELFLHWLLTYEAKAAGYEVTTLAHYVETIEPSVTIGLRENSAWSCLHGLGRWATGCPCTPGNGTWKGALRRALDNLRYELDGIYHDQVRRIDERIEPVALRDAYICVVLGVTRKDQLLKQREIDVSGNLANRLATLIEAQFYRQQMYSSSVFFFADLDSPMTRYGIASAAYAIKLTKEATGEDLGPAFRRDLSIATGQSMKTGDAISGGAIYDEVVSEID